MLDISYKEHKTKEYVWQQVNILAGCQELLLSTEKRYKLSWYGHVCHHDSLPKIILQGTADGDRYKGRPHRSWKDNIKEWTGQSMSSYCASQTTTEASHLQASVRVTQQRLGVKRVNIYSTVPNIFWQAVMLPLGVCGKPSIGSEMVLKTWTGLSWILKTAQTVFHNEVGNPKFCKYQHIKFQDRRSSTCEFWVLQFAMGTSFSIKTLRTLESNSSKPISWHRQSLDSFKTTWAPFSGSRSKNV